MRARRHEAEQDREGRKQSRPQVQVRRGPSLREPDPHEAVVEVVVVGVPRATRRYLSRFSTTNDVSRIGTARTSSGPTSAIVAAVFSTPFDRHGREDEAERKRAGIAHEDPCRVVVVRQERERRAADDRRQRGGVDAPEGSRQDREGHRRDRHDSRSERVHAVDQVDEVREDRRSTAPSAGSRPSRDRGRR